VHVVIVAGVGSCFTTEDAEFTEEMLFGCGRTQEAALGGILPGYNRAEVPRCETIG
jgi:hypothetical protein